MPKPVTLDPRKARKLNSRECAKVIGGCLGGLASAVGAARTKEILELFVTDRFWDAWDSEGQLVACDLQLDTGAPQEEVVACRTIGGLVGGLLSTSSKRAIQTAVAWWLQNEQAWSGDRIKNLT